MAPPPPGEKPAQSAVKFSEEFQKNHKSEVFRCFQVVVFSRKKNWQNTKNIPATKEEIVFWFQDRPGGGVLTLSVPCTKPTLMALLTAIHIEWGLQKTVASNNLGVHRGALKTLAGVHRLTTPFFLVSTKHES